MSSIRDVAKEAGVSTATVSRVLNNDLKYKITSETRQRVIETAERLNYSIKEKKKPEHVVNERNRRKRNTCTNIGCVLSVTRNKFSDPYYMSILSAIEGRLSANGYNLTSIKTIQELKDKSALKDMFSQPLAGVILMEDLDQDMFDYISQNVPCIVGIDTKHKSIDNIAYDHYEAAETAVQHLIDQGYKKIGYIGGHGSFADIHFSQRYKGYHFTMLKNDLPINDRWVIDCDWNDDVCIEQIGKLCKSKNIPEAFFVASDLMAMAALNSFYTNGVKVPDQVAVMGLTDLEIAKYSNPPLSTIHIPVEEIGIVAADMLVSRVEGYSMLPQRIILPVKTVVRLST